MIEQRIARRRHQHPIAGRRAQQLEQQRVGLAGARGQDDPIPGREDAIGAHSRRRPLRARCACRTAPAGSRRPRRCDERREQVGRIGDAGAGRVADRQVDQIASRRARRVERLSKMRSRCSGGGTRAENIRHYLIMSSAHPSTSTSCCATRRASATSGARWLSAHPQAMEAAGAAGRRAARPSGKLIDHIFLVERRHSAAADAASRCRASTGLTGSNVAAALRLRRLGAPRARAVRRRSRCRRRRRGADVRGARAAVADDVAQAAVSHPAARDQALGADRAGRPAGRHEPPGDHDLFFSSALR